MSEKLEIILSEDERDCLQELMNIAYGSATAAITEIISKFATLSIPRIHTIDSHELKDYLNTKLKSQKKYYIANQLVNGQLSGENLFVIDEKSSTNLTKEFDVAEDEMNEDEIKDVILEITNILSSSVSGKLASLLNSNISFGAPSITKIDTINDFDQRFESEYTQVIIISTDLNFEDQNIHGELMVLSKSDTANFLKSAIEQFMEDY
jgi:chemotaxis protein CheC